MNILPTVLRAGRRGTGRGVLVIAVILGAVPAAAASAQAPDDDAAATLAARYAPVVVLQDEGAECDGEGEPFAPMSVDAVLGNPQVALRQVGRGDPVVAWGPTANDLFGLGEGFFVDFPGNALTPRCVYEQDYDRYTSGRPPVVYAHIATQADRPDVIAVQYWMYWYYNDWNNRHESDWEMIQVVLPASSVEEALDVEPLSVGYAQHEGGHRAEWDGTTLEREGTRPVVYSSARSHASYFGAAVYLGRSAGEGFGCDTTDGPHSRVDPDVVVLPDAADDAADEFAWLGFDGHWGERHAAPNDSPTGPAGRRQWTRPIDWHDELRDASVVVPGGDSRAARLVEEFCTAVAWGSMRFIEVQASPTKALICVAVVLVLALSLARRTSWRRVEPVPLAGRRRAGEIARSAFVLYRRHAPTFILLGLVVVPVAGAAAIATPVIRALPLVGDLVTVADPDGNGTRLVFAGLLTGLVSALTFVVVSAAVAHVIGDVSESRPASARAALAAVRARAGALWRGKLRSLLTTTVLSLTVVGIPLAIREEVRHHMFAPSVMLEGLDGRSGLKRSERLVTGRWWHTAAVQALTVAALGVVVVACGLLTLVVFRRLPLWAVSAFVTAFAVVVMPLGAIVTTLLYGDAVAAERDLGTTVPTDA